MRKSLRALGVALAGLFLVLGVNAANIAQFTGPTGSNPANVPGNVPDLNALVNEINAGITGNSVAAFSPLRNYLDNGAMFVAQRGLATTGSIGQINAAAMLSVNYKADRWAVSTNVASGAGFGQVITATPSPPSGFKQTMKIYRNSGILTQPICALQEISTNRSIQLQGQQVTLSFYAQALANLAADNSNVINAYVIYGTGSDEGLGSWTASPAITPAWTGIASLQPGGTIGTATTITTAWARYSGTVNIPTTATEVGVLLCFTPTAAAVAGTTDGFAFVGVQLEPGSAASPFAYLPYADELAQAQFYFAQWADVATTTRQYPATCTEITSGTTALCNWLLPRSMRVAPTVVVLTAQSFGKTKVADGTAGACSTLALVASSATTDAFGVTCALSETAAVGTMGVIIGANTATTNTVSASADF